MSVSITAAAWVSPAFCSWTDLRDLSGQPRSAAEPWFVPEDYLGKRGHKYLSNASKFLLAASVRTLEAGGDLSIYDPQRIGIVIGTNQADFWVRRDFDAAVRRGGTQALSAVEAPNSSVNIPASHLAIRHRITGPNLTLTNHLVAGVESLHIGCRLLYLGLADAVLCGAAEESRLEVGAAPALGGACLLLLERSEAARLRGATVLGTIEASSLHFLPEVATAPHSFVKSLAGAALVQDQLWLISHCGHTAAAVARAVSEQTRLRVENLARHNPAFHCDHSLLPLLQFVWLLAHEHEGIAAILSPLGNLVLLNLKPGENHD
jgi:hypothetical protein